jgi:hypothetical protein
MSDIYKQKAKKYKYKYLKLKQELEGGDDILKGGFGCVSIPPISLTGLDITIKYPEQTLSKDDLEKFNTTEYVGKFISCANNAFGKEYDNLELIKKNNWDPEYKYTQELCFACHMNYNNLIEHLKTTNLDLKACIEEKYKLFKDDRHTKGISSSNVCYLITKKVGTSFDILLKQKSYINNNNIISILTSLREGIINFIKKLYNNKFVLGDINIRNMTYDDKQQKVYFIDFGLLYDTANIEALYTNSLNVNYSFIIKKFFSKYGKEDIINKNKHLIYSKSDLINALKIPFYENRDNADRKVIQYFIDLKFDTGHGEYEKTYNNYLENILFKNWIDDSDKDIYEIYEKYIFPIAINTDIYALSLFIFNIVPESYKSFVKQLLIDAIENKITSPTDLVQRLDKIIKEIQLTVPQQRAAPVQQRGVPVQQRAAAPVQQRAAAPVQQRAAAPVQQRAAAPVQQRGVPVQQRAAPVQQRLSTAPVQQRAAAPVQQRLSTAPIAPQYRFSVAPVAPVVQYR